MRTILLLICYCFALSVCRGQQLDMSLPLSGAVYQRNDTGNGTIRVAATLNSATFKDPSSDVVSLCKLWKLDVKLGSWSPSAPPTYTFGLDQDGSVISGTVTVPAGWYQMRIDVTIQFGRQSVTRTRNYRGSAVKVGVGEVFIIAGQSNAQGLPNIGTDINIARPLPTWDGVRVQTNNVDPLLFAQDLNAQNFSTIRTRYLTKTKPVSLVQANEGIAPTGSSLWYWARLGEKLAAQLDVPVAFYNVAWGGTYIKAWSGSTDGVSTPLGRPGNNVPPYPTGAPYLLLKSALQLYGATYGARAILWLQGETDVEAVENAGSWEVRAVSDANDYRDRLQQVIAQTRTDFGPIAWVIGKTSIRADVVKDTPISLLIASGQQLAVQTAPNVSALNTPNGVQVFYGPDMNQSVEYRRPPTTDNSFYPTNTNYGGEPVHFLRKNADNTGNDGLEQAAHAWFQSLSSLLSQIKPASTLSIGTGARTLSISSDGTTVTAPTASQVMWVADDDGAFDLSTPICYDQSVACNSSGRKRAVLRNAQGNYILTQAVNFPYTIVDDTNDPTPPTTTVVCYEAESGSGNRTPESNGSASGGQYVGGFGGPGEYMDYTINGVPSAGNYTLSLFYASGETPRIGLKVNGNTVSTVTPAGTGGWTNFRETTTTISLNAGNNTIRVQGDGGQFTLDKLCVNTGGTTTPTTGCDFAVNTPTVSNGNPGCSGSINLNAGCTGNDCGSAGFAWTLNGTNVATGANPGSISAPGSNGGYTYTVSATKSGCTTKTGTVGITVSGCGPTPPTGNCYEAEAGSRSAGTELSSGGNASGGQYVGGLDSPSRYVDFAVNVTSAGSYPLTFYYSSGEAGGFIDYAVNGGGANRQNIAANGSWNTFIASSAVTVSLNAGANTIRVQGGFRFTLDKICVNGGTTTPPTGNFALDTPSLNCANGDVTLSVINGNSNPVEYQAVGLRGWATGNVLNIPAHQRNGTSFTFQARQSGNSDVSRVFTTGCAGYRIGVTASSEPDADTDTGLVISPNPSSGRVSVRFRLGAGERGSLSVQSLTGAVLQSRAVIGTGAAQTEVLDMEREPSGLYLIRVSGANSKAQTGRVLLNR